MTKSIINTLVLCLKFQGIIDVVKPLYQLHPKFASLAKSGTFRVVKEADAIETLVSDSELSLVSKKSLKIDLVNCKNGSIRFTIQNNSTSLEVVIPSYTGELGYIYKKSIEVSIQDQLSGLNMTVATQGGDSDIFYLSDTGTGFEDVSISGIMGMGPDASGELVSVEVPVTTFENLLLEPFERELYIYDMCGNVGFNPQAALPSDNVTPREINGALLRRNVCFSNKLTGTDQINAFGGDITNSQFLDRILNTNVASTHPGELSYGGDHAILGAMLEFLYTEHHGNNSVTEEPWTLEEILYKEIFDKVGCTDRPFFHIRAGDDRLNVAEDGSLSVDHDKLCEVFTTIPVNFDFTGQSGYSWDNFVGQFFAPPNGFYDDNNKNQSGAGGLAMSCRDFGKVSELLLKGGLDSSNKRLFNSVDLSYMIKTRAVDIELDGTVDLSDYYFIDDKPYMLVNTKTIWGFTNDGAPITSNHQGKNPISYFPPTGGLTNKLAFGWPGAGKTSYSVCPEEETIIVISFQAINLPFNGALHYQVFYDGTNAMHARLNTILANSFT